MRCFYHQDKDAVGSCKSCGKGLCAECAVDLGKGLACRGHCEADAQAVISLIERNIQLQPTTTRLIEAGSSARLAGALFFLVTGALFLIYGLRSERDMTFIAILGACFLVFGIFHLLWSRRISAQKQKSET
ncbi:MAG: hypothetical protein ACYDH9_26640 [Limisphaerales bacterium]